MIAAGCTGFAATKFSRETTVTADGALRFTSRTLVTLVMFVTLVTLVTFTLRTWALLARYHGRYGSRQPSGTQATAGAEPTATDTEKFDPPMKATSAGA